MATMVDSYIFPAPMLPSTFVQPCPYRDEEMQASMVDLTRQLSEHTLDQYSSQGVLSGYPFARPWSFERSPTPPSANISSTSMTTESSLCTSLTSTHFSSVSDCSYSDYSASCIRRQRQRALRSQCSTSHLQAISALVSRMMENGEQCTVRRHSLDHKKETANIGAPVAEAESVNEVNETTEEYERKPCALHKHPIDRRSERRTCIAKDVKCRKHTSKTLNNAATMKR